MRQGGGSVTPNLFRAPHNPTQVQTLFDFLGTLLDRPDSTGEAPVVLIGPRSATEMKVIADRVQEALSATGEPASSHSNEEDRPAEVARRSDLILETSGSSGGRPHLVCLSAQALMSSAAATHERLGGAGRWIVALPVHHIAGLQLLVRSHHAKLPLIIPEEWPYVSPQDLARAVERTKALDPRTPTYTSVVTAQLEAILQSDIATLESVQKFDAILVGGGPISRDLLERSRAGGLHVIPTYGMTETCGGCVYDGIPLPNTRLTTDDDGRVLIASSALMEGYLDEESPWTTIPSGELALATSDLGRIDEDGRLWIEGRIDDVVNSGGMKVSTVQVANAITALPGVQDAACVGVPDPKWGQMLAALVVPEDGVDVEARGIYKSVKTSLGAHAAPKMVVWVSDLPRTSLGKVNSNAVRAIIQDAIRRGDAWTR